MMSRPTKPDFKKEAWHIQSNSTYPEQNSQPQDRTVLDRQTNSGAQKMKFFLRIQATAICSFFIAGFPAAAAELVFIQKEETVQKTGAAGGRFQTALGKALAERMGRTVRYLDLPRKRFSDALESGEGDVLCGYQPEWMPGAFDWSRPFIPVVEVLVTAARVPAPAALSDLKGKRIGTVLGFIYPELDKALGKDFVRDDAPSTNSSLRKLMAGRFDYMITTMPMINSQLNDGEVSVPLHPPLVIKEVQTQCAVSRHGNVKLEELNKAIEALLKSGEFAKLQQQYRQ